MKYLMYALYTEEPIKMGSSGKQSDVEKALKYIAGSSIRGAFINKYIKKYIKENESNEEFINKNNWILKETFFSDAYIGDKNEENIFRTITIPLVFYAEKEQIRHSNGEKDLSVHSVILPNDKPKDGEEVATLEKYGFVSNKGIKVLDVNMIDNMHIKISNKSSNSGEDKNQIFRYEAIDRGQIFIGYIKVTDEKLQQVKNIIKVNDIFYIGGSKGSGYGRCRVISVSLKDDISYEDILNIKKNKCIEYENKKYFTIYAASNLILLNEFGGVTNIIEEKFLEKKLGLKDVKLEKAMISSNITDGYNHKWKGRNIQQTAVSAGSVYLYSFQGIWDEEKAKDIEENGIGQRKTEGFGNIIFNMCMNSNKIQAYRKNNKNDEDNKKEITNEDKVIIQNMINDIYVQRANNEFIKAYYDAETKYNILNLSSSQIVKLYDVITRALLSENKEIINKHKKDIKSKESSKTYKAYQKEKINNKNMFEILEYILDDKEKFENFNTEINLKSLVLNKDSNEIRAKEFSEFQKKCLFMKNVLYYFIREEKEKDDKNTIL